jgi:hypothetical protein
VAARAGGRFADWKRALGEVPTPEVVAEPLHPVPARIGIARPAAVRAS